MLRGEIVEDVGVVWGLVFGRRRSRRKIWEYLGWNKLILVRGGIEVKVVL